MSQQLPPQQARSPLFQSGFQPQASSGQQIPQSFQGTFGGRYDQTVSPAIQNAVNQLERLESMVEWAKTRCAQRGHAGAVRICDDMEDIAHVTQQLLLRESPLLSSMGPTAQQSIQAGIQELQQHSGEPEVLQSIEQAQQALAALQQGLAQYPPSSQGQQFSWAGQQPVQPASQSW